VGTCLESLIGGNHLQCHYSRLACTTKMVRLRTLACCSSRGVAFNSRLNQVFQLFCSVVPRRRYGCCSIRNLSRSHRTPLRDMYWMVTILAGHSGLCLSVLFKVDVSPQHGGFSNSDSIHDKFNSYTRNIYNHYTTTASNPSLELKV
jgi:hypothetical protein